MFSRILFAHDGGMLAERALVYLEHIARSEGAEVLVLHAYALPDRYSAMEGYDALRAQHEAIAQEVVDDAVSHLEERGISAHGFAAAGDSARAILETAARDEVSLIVVGSRGPSSVADLVLGNVTMEVLRYARCPVLVVP